MCNFLFSLFCFLNLYLSPCLLLPGSPHCERCPSEFWSNDERTACVPRQVDFLSFNETLGITLTAAAVSGVVVTSAVFVVFLHYRHTPMVREQSKRPHRDFIFCSSAANVYIHEQKTKPLGSISLFVISLQKRT